VSDRKPYRHRFPLSVIGYALRLYYRFPLSQRDVQELLHERGIHVSHETLRQWNIKFAPLLTEELRHREPRRGSRWHLDEVCVKVGGVKHWLWRAVDERGDVLDILLQEHRDTEAAKSFFVRLLSEYDVPEIIHTDKLWSYGAALRELPVLHGVEHVQVVSTARCNNLVEQRAGVLKRVRSAQDNRIDRHGSRNAVSSALNGEDGLRNSSTSTLDSRIFTDTPEPPSPPSSDEATKPQHFSSAERRCSRRLDFQAACELLRPG